MAFPNKAGDHADTDDILRAELKAAGIPTLQEAAGNPPDYLDELLRSNSGEVKTSVIGTLHGWQFKRGWYYWMAEGPGLDVETAESLHAVYGTEVRVAGHCGCPSPREWFKGLGCGNYHVDTPEGLKALADAIKQLADKSAGLPPAKAGHLVPVEKIWNFLVEDHIEWNLKLDVFNDNVPEKDEEFFKKASRLLPSDYVAEKINELCERKAERIYNTWNNQHGFLPWEPGGNSDRQLEARKLAHEEKNA